jgi:acetolactate synthase-1/2/3 large subunit
MKLSDFVVKFFEDKGITDAFTVSGGGCIHLIDSLRTSNMNTTCVHHEQSALMASEGYFRMNNKMALNVVTTGPGGTNAVTGLLGLWLDSIPSVIISGQVQKSQLSAGTGCRQIGDQEFDILSVVKPMVKYCTMVTSPDDILNILETAYQTAIEGRPGPVWIDIPLDLQAATVDLDKLNSVSYIPKIHQIGQEVISNIKQLLESSTKPVVVVGNGVRLSDTYTELNTFLSKNNIPVVTGPHSGVDAVDNTLPYYAGRIGILGQLTSNQIIQEADLILGIGTRLPVKMTGYNVNAFAPYAKKVLIDIDINEMNKHKFHVDMKIVADLRDILPLLVNTEFDLNIDEWRTFVQSKRKEQIYVYDKHKNMQNYTSFYQLINKAPKFFGNTPIVTSNGTAHVITLQTYNLNKHQRLFTNVGCASMGYGLPAAIGACLANNKKDVVCVEGDGSIMMNLQELQTVVGYNLPVKILLINNDGYLSIKMTQESFFDGHEFGSGKENGVTIPNFEKLSNALNIPYYKIENNSQIEDGLDAFMKHEGYCLLEVFVHPKERHEPKVTHKGIDADGKIIPGTLTDMKITEGF